MTLGSSGDLRADGLSYLRRCCRAAEITGVQRRVRRHLFDGFHYPLRSLNFTQVFHQCEQAKALSCAHPVPQIDRIRLPSGESHWQVVCDSGSAFHANLQASVPLADRQF